MERSADRIHDRPRSHSRCRDDYHDHLHLRQSPAVCLYYAAKLLPSCTAIAGALVAPFLNGITAAQCTALVALLLSCGIAALKWHRFLLDIDRRILRRQHGLLIRRTCVVVRSSLRAVEITRTPLLSLLGAARLHFYVPAVSRSKGCALSAVVPKTAACVQSRSWCDDPCCDIDTWNAVFRRDIFRRFNPRRRRHSRHSSLFPRDFDMAPVIVRRRFASDRASLFLAAASHSNVFSGLLLAIPFIYRLGAYIDEQQVQRLYGDLAVVGTRLLGIPVWLSAVLLLIPIGWLVHFFINLVRSDKHHVTLTQRGTQLLLCLSRGGWARRTIRFRPTNITAVDIRHTPLGSLLRRQSCTVCVPGCGELTLYPAIAPRALRIELASLLERTGVPVTVRTPADQHSRLYVPWLATAAATALLWLRLVVGGSSDALWTVFVPVIILLLWRAFAGMLCSHRSGLRLFADWVEIVGVRGFCVHELRIRRTDITHARIVRTPFHLRGDYCDVLIRHVGSRRYLRCRRLPAARALALLELLR